MKFKYLLLVLSIAAVLALYCAVSLARPPVVEIADVPSHADQQVVVRGIVLTYRSTSSGNLIITLRDPEAATGETITLFLEGSTEVSEGDLVEAEGRVQLYKGGWELQVADPSEVVVLVPAMVQRVPLRQLAAEPLRYSMTTVTVSGTVTALQTSTLELTDPESQTTITVRGPLGSASLAEGMEVTVTGRFTYDDSLFLYHISLCDATHRVEVVADA